MANKKYSLNSPSGTIILILIGIFLYNILNGLTLTFTNLNQESLKSRFSEIQFESPGNDFGGGVFWLPTKSLSTPKVITIGSEKKTCFKQLRGIYYNAARGARLWPLDQETLNLLSETGAGYGNLHMNSDGGLYTACEGDTNMYGIFGYIEYDWNGTTSSIIGGVKLNYQTNSYMGQFTNNLQYFNNIKPLGYFWDSVGGIGFVGGSLSGNEELLNYLNNTGSINSSFVSAGNNNISSSSGNRSIVSGSGTAQDTMRNILIQGNVILSKAIDVYEKRAFLGNLEKRTVLVNSDINSATVINTAKKNTEVLCRGKTYFVGTTPTTLPSNNEKILCYKNTNNLTIDLAQPSQYKNKTIIMKKGNIILKNSMDKESPALDLFIDEGNLYIQNNPTNKTNFSEDGYPTTTAISNSGIFIKGTFIINGLILGGNPGSETTINHKVHLLGKVALLNTPTLPSTGRITQIQNILGSSFTSWISLENLFVWGCDFNLSASDGTACLGKTSLSATPFVVLNAKYPSNVIK